MADGIYFWHADKHQSFIQFDTIILGLQAMHVQSTQNKMFAYLYNILRKKWVMRLISCMQISMKVSYKLILWFLMRVVKHSRSSQNSKFAMSLQYVKKELSDENDSLHADKHQSFLQVDFNTLEVKFVYKVILSLLMDMIKHFQGTRCNKFIISLQYTCQKKS